MKEIERGVGGAYQGITEMVAKFNKTAESVLTHIHEKRQKVEERIATSVEGIREAAEKAIKSMEKEAERVEAAKGNCASNMDGATDGKREPGFLGKALKYAAGAAAAGAAAALAYFFWPNDGIERDYIISTSSRDIPTSSRELIGIHKIENRAEAALKGYLPDGSRQGYVTTYFDNGESRSAAIPPWDYKRLNSLSKAEMREIAKTGRSIRWTRPIAVGPLDIKDAIDYNRSIGRIK